MGEPDEKQDGENNILFYDHCLKIVLKQFKAVIWEWDFENDSIMIISAAHSTKTNMSRQDVEATKFFTNLPVCPEDRAGFEDWLGCVYIGEKTNEIMLKMVNDGVLMQINLAAVPICKCAGSKRVIIIVRDVTEEYAATAKLQQEASNDYLSGLYNRKSCAKLVKNFLRGSQCNQTHALFVIDIDDFKAINDTFGHPIGDKVIARTGCALHGLFRTADIIGRVGGDEFMVLMCNCTEVDAQRKAQEVCMTFCNSDLATPNGSLPHVSIGIAVWPRAGRSLEELYANADAAMYRSKIKGKSCYTIV